MQSFKASAIMATKRLKLKLHFFSLYHLIWWNNFAAVKSVKLLEGGEYLKITWIPDFCSKLSGLGAFENTVDHGSAVIFDADSGLCLSCVQILSPKRNLGRRSFLVIVGILMSSSKLFLSSKEVHLNSCVRLLLELFCVIIIKHVAFFTFGWKINSGIHLYQFTF